MKLLVAQQVADTEAEGPGHRFALWVQGCSLRCPGCCNPEMFGTDKGRATDSADLAAQVLTTPGLEGVSLLGGEPTEQAEALADFAERVGAGGLTVMLYSGYTLAELHGRGPQVERLLGAVDLLVDGRFEQARPEQQRRWIGSANQQLHFLSNRYVATDPRFATSNTVELRLTREGLSVNGWPSSADALRRAGR